jgi:hypothetical protein
MTHKVRSMMLEMDRLSLEIHNDRELLARMKNKRVLQDELDHLQRKINEKKRLYSAYHTKLIERYDELVAEIKTKRQTKKDIEFLLKHSAEVYRGA